MSSRTMRTALSAALLVTVAGCANNDKVSFQDDVKPILDMRCLSCHSDGGEGYEESGLSVATYKDVMKGTKFGPVIVPGDSVSSTLTRLIEHKTDPAIHMPHGKDPLTDQQIATINAWIDAGAKDN